MYPKPSIRRTLMAGLAGGAAFVLGTFLTFAQFSGSRRGAEGVLSSHAPTAAGPMIWRAAAEMQVDGSYNDSVR
jgi:hypothetical protein